MNIDRAEHISGDGQNRRIVTHAGSAHADEVVSIALLLAHDECIGSIDRVKDVTSAELDDASAYVLDVGRRHEPHLLNFDHHQFDGSDRPRCTLSLVLDYLGAGDVARRIWPWLTTFEHWDTGGPVAVAKQFNVPDLTEILPFIPSPIEDALTDLFSAQCSINKADEIYRMLRMLGLQMMGEIQQLPELIDQCGQLALVSSQIPPGVPAKNGKGVINSPEWIDSVVLAKWPDAPRALARKAFRLYLQEQAPKARLTITPDERGNGCVLTSVSDTERLDLRVLAGDPDVAFVHANGFMAVTKTGEPQSIERLMLKINSSRTRY